MTEKLEKRINLFKKIKKIFGLLTLISLPVVIIGFFMLSSGKDNIALPGLALTGVGSGILINGLLAWIILTFSLKSLLKKKN